MPTLQNIRRLHLLNSSMNSTFLQKLKTNLKEDRLVTVQVPSAGGGLTNVEIPESYLIDYLVKQNLDYDSSKLYKVYDPKVIEKAKSENPERFADPLDNMLNHLMMGGAGLSKAFTTGALQLSGKALTDLMSKMSFSNAYTTGVGLAATPTTGAVIGDAALATATLVPVTYDISKNGLNLVNSTEAALGLLPVVGPVANNLSIGARNTKRAVDEFRLAREINKSAKNTKLINKEIEVVSPVGVTEGAGLNVRSNSDIGFHFSPRWSSTSTAILNLTGHPFIRIGYLTTSENIPYVIVNDKGNWSYRFNPEIYRGVNPGNTLSDNVLALDKIGPNFKYTNLYEGKGNPSYFTTDTNSIYLSKNAQVPIYKEEHIVLKPLQIEKGVPIKTDLLGQLSAQNPSGIWSLRLDDDGSAVISLQLHPDIVNTYILPYAKKAEDMYNSEFYRKRLETAGITDPNKLDEIISELIKNMNNVEYYSVPLDPSTGAQTYKIPYTGKHVIEFNSNPKYPHPVPYDLLHELGHVGENGIPIINDYNKKLLENWKLNLYVDYDSNKKALDYLFRVYPEGVSEPRGMLMPSVYLMKKLGLTGKQLLESPYAKTDKNLDNYRIAKGDEWVANVLDKLLVMSPIIGATLANNKNENLINNE